MTVCHQVLKNANYDGQEVRCDSQSSRVMQSLTPFGIMWCITVDVICDKENIKDLPSYAFTAEKLIY